MVPLLEQLKNENPFFLAPMEAVNCASYRVLCKKRGASLVFTDMIDVDEFYTYAQEHGVDAATQKYINPQKEEEGSLVIQLGGKKREHLEFTAKAVERYAVMIDYNVGCPLSSMLAKKGGCYLMKHPDQLYTTVQVLLDSVTVPVSVKLRSGWDEQSINILEIAAHLETMGVAMITVHARTKKQLYEGKSDWKLVRKVKDQLAIPLCLSGDVFNAYDAHIAFMHTKCDFIMCARGAKHNPSLFTDLLTYWQTKTQPKKPTHIYNKNSKQAKQDFLEFYKLYKEREYRNNLSELQDHTRWTVRDLQCAKEMIQKIAQVESEEELIALMKKL